MGMKQSLTLFAFCAYLLFTCPAVTWGADYKAPLPYAVMYDRLAIGMTRQQAYEITRAAELQREPADLETTDLLRSELVNRRCQAQILRLHWYKGALHWVEYIQLDSAGITYQERGDPDPIGERLVRRLTDIAHLYASHWEELAASIAHEGSPALQTKVEQMADNLKRRLEELRAER
ncbi:hypothetical protein [Candidatus Methylomirabilis sp.]|uniref:DUF4468 domain-containing protein n=1 Tax=Candidatus Methylomirabilis tolerans TaxID=3123416 RepID=A0AAJ1AH79_9BACT|nr:hypothetical protein [Candidatus Methylomirabilis sp.]